MQLPTSISIGPEKVMDAIQGALKAAFRQGQKARPQPLKTLSLDTSGDNQETGQIPGQIIDQEHVNSPAKMPAKATNQVDHNIASDHDPQGQE